MATRPTKPAKPKAQPAKPAPPQQPSEVGAANPQRPAGTAPSQSAAGTARPPALRLAAAAQAVEAAGLCVAAVFAAVDTADGQSYQRASGVALTLIAFGAAAVLALLAMGLAKARPWSRTPAVMTQLFVGGAGIYLLDGHRLDWGIPALLVAAACLAAILAPASLRALNRPPRP